jgi:hypothetical protein
MCSRLSAIGSLISVVCVVSGALLAQPAGPRSLPDSARTQPEEGLQQGPARPGELKGLTIDPGAGHVDIQAKLIRREAKWLELLATTPGMREHEALLTIDARPRHIHLGLLMLGLKPGRPLDVVEQGEGWAVKPPKGPAVQVRLLYEKDGEQRNVAANKWIFNREKDKPLGSNRWLFTGSLFATFEGERFYMADRSGSVITLVGFGDDLLTRETTMTNRSDGQQWAANTKLLPKKGAAVTIRLKPAPQTKGTEKAEPTGDAEPATTQPSQRQ